MMTEINNWKAYTEMLQLCESERPRYMPKAAAIQYLNLCYSSKSRSRSAKKEGLQRLPHICHAAKYKRSSSSHWRTGTRKPKSRSRRFGLFCKGQGHIFHLPCKTILSSMTVHDNVAVAVIVSEIWALNFFI